MTAKSKHLIEQAFLRDKQRIIKYLIHVLRDAETAHDIAQSAFLRTWEISDTTLIENPSGFLFKAASNLARNELRRRDRYNRRHVGTSRYAKEEIHQELESTVPTPEHYACLREDVVLVTSAISSLPRKVRHAFILSRFEGLSYRQISLLLKVSESSVEKYIMNALQCLRDCIDGIGILELEAGESETVTRKSPAHTNISIFAELSQLSRERFV